MECDVAYYEFYNIEENGPVTFTSESGKVHDCIYYIYTPMDGEIDESTPVIAYVTHGGGTAGDERATALGWAAGFETEAIVISPNSDRPDAICACIEDAKQRLNEKGNFAAVSGHGTSSGGRAMLKAALRSVDPAANYSFRFANIFAYDPAHEITVGEITDQTDAMRRLAEQGTILFFQTDTDVKDHHGGSGKLCNAYAEAYSRAGGTSIVAEIPSASHESKFLKPLAHNSFGWAIGQGTLEEDEYYHNTWYYYRKGIKVLCIFEGAARLLHPEQYQPVIPSAPAKSA